MNEIQRGGGGGVGVLLAAFLRSPFFFISGFQRSAARHLASKPVHQPLTHQRSAFYLQHQTFHFIKLPFPPSPPPPPRVLSLAQRSLSCNLVETRFFLEKGRKKKRYGVDWGGIKEPSDAVCCGFMRADNGQLGEGI